MTLADNNALPNSLLTQLRQQLQDAETVQIAQSIFGIEGADPSTSTLADQIASQISQYCQQQWNAQVWNCQYLYFSVGATVVVTLATGATVAIKAYGPDQNLSALTACLHIQHKLAAHGFPCPLVRALPTRIGTTIFSGQQYQSPGEPVDPLNLDLLSTSAWYLARLLRQAQSFSQAALSEWMDLHQVPLWHKPHNALFDFEKTAAGAKWIDDIARQAKQILLTAQGKPVIGHTDWSLQNMSFHWGKLTCVYDWDSLRVGLEPCFVGGAARCFRHDWRVGPPNPPISVAETTAFINAYEQERGQPFTAEEHQILGAALVYTAAYGTRCAHALDTGQSTHAQGAKQQLQTFASHYLASSFSG